MSLNKILIIVVFFLTLALFVVFKYMYIPERDKAVLYGQKIEAMDNYMKEVNNALLATSESKEEFKQVKRDDASANSWADGDVPNSVSVVLQNAYKRASKN